MKIKFVYTYFLILLISISRYSFAQNPSFSASLSNSTVSLGERFQVTFTLTASGKDFTPPSFKDFSVIQGPNQTNSVQFINGTTTQSISFIYILQPKAEGTFKIGSATIIYNGKIYQSNPLTITVTKGSKKPEGEDDVTKEIEKNLFIKPIYNKTTVYQGEGISVTYKLFTRVSLVNFNPTKMPELNGFWNQEVSHPQQIELKREVIDGIEYNTAEIKKMVLFPQHSGTLLLDPMEAESVVRIQARRKQQSQDPFDQFFNDPFFNAGRYEDINYKISSKPIKINVLPLPANAPEGFSGAVGNFTMNAFIDKPETKTNEAVSLKIKISGKGNIKLIDPVKVNFPSDIESYNPKTADNITVNESGVSGSRTFEYLLIPRHPGEFKIAPIHFSYFDTDKKKYIELESPPFTLKVAKGANDVISSSSSGVSKEELQLLGKDIRYIKTTHDKFSKRGEYFFNSAFYYILLTSPLLLFFGFIFYRSKQKEIQGNTVLFKSKRATQVAKKKLVSAKKFLKENNKEKFYDEILKSIWGYTSDKLNIPLADLSKDNAVSVLKTRNVNDALIKKYTATIDHCEFARYAPAGSGASMENIYEDTMLIISQLEQDLK